MPCRAENHPVKSQEYPWWVATEAVEELFNWHMHEERWFKNWTTYENSRFKDLEKIQDVKFLYPSIVLKMKNIANYSLGLDPHEFIGLWCGYTFSMYLEDSLLGHITIRKHNHRWMVSTMTCLPSNKLIYDHCARLYEKYDDFTDLNIALSGQGTTFMVIEDDQIDQLISFADTLGGYRDCVDVPLDTFLVDSRDKWIIYYEPYSKSSRPHLPPWDNEGILLINGSDRVKSWAEFKQDMLNE